jgi:hypothetical protein
MYPAVLLMYFISAAVILLASLALIVQVSLPYNNNGRATFLHFFYLQCTKVLSSELISKQPVSLFQNAVEMRYPGLSPTDM